MQTLILWLCRLYYRRHDPRAFESHVDDGGEFHVVIHRRVTL